MLSQLQNKLSNLGISPQEIQAKVADKLNLKKSKSTPAQGSQEQQQSMSPTKPQLKSKIPSDPKKSNVFQGIRLENDPLEREIYVKCPVCTSKVFDSGLENELQCERCHLVFVSGKHYSDEQLRQMRIDQVRKQLAQIQGAGGPTNAEDAGEEEEEEAEGEDGYEYDEEEDNSSSEDEDNEQEELKKSTMSQSQKSPNKKHKQKLQIDPKIEKEEEKSPLKKHILTEIKGSQSPTKMPSSNQSPQKQRVSSAKSNTDSSSKYVNELEDVVIFCNKETVMADFINQKTQCVDLLLISQSLLKPFFQLRTRILEKGTYFKIGDIEFYVAACEPYDFGKVSSNTTLKCTQSVSKSDVIQRVNLVPLRRLDNSRTAIFETAIKPTLEERKEFYIHKNQVLEFEDYEFYVKYSRPFFGRIDLETTDIKIDSSTPKPVQVLRIAPIWNTDSEYDRANTLKAETQQYIKDTYLNPYFFCGFMCYVERGETLKIENQEFFLNDCRPKCGIVDKHTIIDLEVGFTQEVFKKKQVLADQRFAEKIHTRDITTTNTAPLSGNQIRMRVASQQQQRAEEIEEFIRYAVASGADIMELLDDRGTRGGDVRQGIEGRLRRRTGGSNQQSDEYQLLMMLQQQAQLQQRLLAPSQQRQQQQQQTTPLQVVHSLPDHQISEEFLLREAAKDDETHANKKCMICIMDYEVGESVRTMPCLHFFHSECIDKWLLTRSTSCPICKFDIRKNYSALVEQ